MAAQVERVELSGRPAAIVRAVLRHWHALRDMNRGQVRISWDGHITVVLEDHLDAEPENHEPIELILKD